MARARSRAKMTGTESPVTKVAVAKGSTKAKSNGIAAAPAKPPRASRASKPASALITQEQIAAKAYEIWESKGRPLGLDEQNWQEAEAALAAG